MAGDGVRGGGGGGGGEGAWEGGGREGLYLFFARCRLSTHCCPA